MLRPVRRDRCFGAKSDPIDADAAAGAMLSGKATAVPKAGDAGVEMVRALKIAKQTAIKARTQAVNAVKGLVVMTPDPIRERLRHLKTPALVRTCSAYRVDRASDPTSAIKLSLRSMCRRYIALDREVRSLEKELDALTIRLVPQLRERFGVGQDVAATLVLAAGNSGDRVTRDSEVPAGHRDVAGDLLDVPDDGESSSCSPG